MDTMTIVRRSGTGCLKLIFYFILMYLQFYFNICSKKTYSNINMNKEENCCVHFQNLKKLNELFYS